MMMTIRLLVHSHEQSNGEYHCGGTVLVYSHPEPDREEIDMKGPLAEDIQLLVRITALKHCYNFHSYTRTETSYFTPQRGA